MRRVACILFTTAVAATLIGACSDDDGGRSSAPATTTSVPAYAGELRNNLEKLVRDLRIPSAVVVVKSKSKGDWSATFGTRTLGGNDPVTLADHYRIGSVTKTMTGTIVLQLVQEGKLGLDDPVSKYQPDVPNGDNITIRMLLEMRSGIHNPWLDDEFQRVYNEPGKVWQPSEILRLAFAAPPSFPPGEGFEYSNTNYVLLGLIIEKVTGRSFGEELQQRIIGPLNLRQTVYPAPNDTSIPSPHPHGYIYGTLGTGPSDAEIEAAAQGGPLSPNDVTDENISAIGPDGRAISTGDDMARYVEALVNGGLLSPEMQRIRLASIKPGNAANPGYGLGIAKEGPWFGHAGGLAGWNTFVGGDPEAGNSVVVLTSILLAIGPTEQYAYGQIAYPAHELVQAVTAALYGQALPDHPDPDAPVD